MPFSFCILSIRKRKSRGKDSKVTISESHKEEISVRQYLEGLLSDFMILAIRLRKK